MDLSTFIVSIFRLIDERIKDRCVRQRHPAPRLFDSEVLTTEVLGEFLGIDTDEGHPPLLPKTLLRVVPHPQPSASHHFR